SVKDLATNACDVNQQLESNSHLPPRKRLLAGFKKQNSKTSGSNESPNPSSSSSSSSTSTTTFSNGSSSASLTDVQTQLNDDQSRSPEELAQTSKANAVLAVKAAKAARAAANEKAIIASKAVAAAKSALELFASLPVGCKEKSPRKKKHVPVQVLYSKGGLADEDLASRLNRAVYNSPRVLTDCSSGHRNKKQKSLVTSYVNSTVTSTMYDGNDDVAGVVDSDSSIDEEVDRTRVNGKLLLCDNTLKEKTWEESSSLGKRRGRVKLKKLPLSMCASSDQENGITLAEKNVSVSKPE
ncbi:PREDICTED: uncharacterized protein DDB_G0271670-like, partial [Camelina sativa]|uniref:Uncharacterized protein DDB_G0271670-like n=1 Tax=Camelina sativa TaxID=90675 RepID=A0ABM1RH88_CAMSA